MTNRYITQNINIGVSPEMKQDLWKAAEKMQLSPSQVCRLAIRMLLDYGISYADAPPKSNGSEVKQSETTSAAG